MKNKLSASLHIFGVGATDNSRPKWRLMLNILVYGAIFLSACQTAEEEFVSGKLLSLCDDAYWLCDVPAGCNLDSNHYVEGAFPGVRRVVVETDETDMDVQVRLYFTNAITGGTELLVQLYESDCILDRQMGQGYMVDVDILDEAGDDRVLIFDLHVMQEGEHVLEIYSDMTSEFLLIAE